MKRELIEYFWWGYVITDCFGVQDVVYYSFMVFKGIIGV